ncbi:hypothetical protein QUF49_03830 [Fictibacillus sp. b24]|uniref:hypothetical protein n=1 Tax=Fictibacillus sp. b24 TaxID=3055863 RepID=UPI0025A13275|nr:hypothetical protein [Fictibacillus sp. b24]MDM5315111.1 hypothetical protein [Fictibacillus sp. b24]
MSFKNVTKKDIIFGFIVLILIGIIITIITWRAGDSSIIVNQISLASGLSSIVLAVIAIFYSFIESRASASDSENIRSSLSEIQMKINDLNRISEELEVIKNQLYTVGKNESSAVYHNSNPKTENQASTNEGENFNKFILQYFHHNKDKDLSLKDINNYLISIGEFTSPIGLQLALGVLVMQGFLVREVSVEDGQFYYRLREI